MMEELLKKIKSLRVAVVGDVMLDAYTHGGVERISPEAPVPVLSATRDEYRPGGASNVALNAAVLGASSVELCGVYGEDTNGTMLREILKKRGCALSVAWQRPGVRTITKRRFVVGRQQMLRVDYEDAPALYSIDLKRDAKALSQGLHRADVVILSDYARGAINSEVISAIQKVCQKQNTLLAVGLKPKNSLVFRDATLVTLNRKESLELSGIQCRAGELFPAAAVCEKLYARYHPKHLAITLSEEGMIICTDGKVGGQIPTFAREVYDVSGAGDTVIAGLSLALAAGGSLIEAARLANLAAGVVVGKAGTATATPEEILSLMKLMAVAGLTTAAFEARVETKQANLLAKEE
jgi:D-beta-D-heptose 7-phosphate kinase/D-beta-D-heptose 1-phosphate adenosyltransferase